MGRAAPDGAVSRVVTINPLDQTAEEIATIAGNPVIIVNQSLVVVGSSYHDAGKADEVRKRTILEKRIPAGVAHRFERSPINAAVCAGDRPVRIPAAVYDGKHPRVVMAIKLEATLLGFVVIAEDPSSQVPESAFPGIRRLTEQAAHTLMVLTGEGHSLASLVADLLKGTDATEGFLMSRFHSLGCPVPKWWTSVAVLVEKQQRRVDCRDLGVLMRHRDKGFELVAELSDHSCVFVARDHMASESEALAILGPLLSDWLDSGAVAGVARPVSSLTRVWASHQESLAAARIGSMFWGPGSVTLSKNLGALLTVLSDFDGVDSEFESGFWSRLRSHDRENNSNLVESCVTYLLSLGNARLAARRLHIHPSTLSYRLNRLRKLTGVDLDDAHSRLMVQLEYYIGLARAARGAT